MAADYHNSNSAVPFLTGHSEVDAGTQISPDEQLYVCRSAVKLVHSFAHLRAMQRDGWITLPSSCAVFAASDVRIRSTKPSHSPSFIYVDLTPAEPLCSRQVHESETAASRPPTAFSLGVFSFLDNYWIWADFTLSINTRKETFMMILIQTPKFMVIHE